MDFVQYWIFMWRARSHYWWNIPEELTTWCILKMVETRADSSRSVNPLCFTQPCRIKFHNFEERFNGFIWWFAFRCSWRFDLYRLSFGSWVEFISKKISRTFNFHNLIILHHFVCSIHFPFSSFFYEIFMSFSVFFSFSFLAWRFACKLWNHKHTKSHTSKKISAPGYNTAYNAYNSYNPVSRRDSELASLSSGRTDSDTMSISSMSTTWVMSFLFFHFFKFKGSGFRRLALLLLMFMLYKLSGRINIKLISSFNYQFLSLESPQRRPHSKKAIPSWTQVSRTKDDAW